MRIIILSALVAVSLCWPLLAAEGTVTTDGMRYYQMENGRFYSCALLNNNGAVRLVAVGQRTGGMKNHKKKNQQGQKKHGANRQGYVAVLVESGETLTVEAEDRFQVTHDDHRWPTRIRTVAVVNRPGGTDADIYISGRGGADEEGIGFLRHYSWENNRLIPGKTITMEQTRQGIDYTHGYTLKTGDIDGDGKQEAVYGGFFGKTINEHLSEDYADVRVFKKNATGSIEEAAIKPFEQFKKPLRVNALEVKDIDGDGKAEIIIAGRSREGDIEYSAFAIWSGGKVSYHVNREQSLPGRFRTVEAMDIDGDGKDELITGGRIDLGKRMVADLQVWKLNSNGVSMLACYNWTSDASTRLRDLAETTVNGQLIAAGRTELRHSGETPRWLGFIRRFQLKNGSLWPTDLPFLLDKGPENRIRDIRHIGSNHYISAGFIMKAGKKSSGFVMVF